MPRRNIRNIFFCLVPKSMIMMNNLTTSLHFSQDWNHLSTLATIYIYTLFCHVANLFVHILYISDAESYLFTDRCNLGRPLQSAGAGGRLSHYRIASGKTAQLLSSVHHCFRHFYWHRKLHFRYTRDRKKK